MNKVLKVVLVVVLIFTSISFSINYLLKYIKLDKDDYIKVLLDGPVKENVFKKTINIFTVIDPTYFIEVPSYKVPFNYIIKNDPDIIIFSSNKYEYKPEFSFVGDSNLTAYLLSSKLDNSLFIDNVYEYLSINNITLDEYINELHIRYNGAIIIDVGIDKKISVTSSIDNFELINYINTYLYSNYLIYNVIYLSDINYIKLNIGSKNDTMSDVLEYIDYITSALKDYYER